MLERTKILVSGRDRTADLRMIAKTSCNPPHLPLCYTHILLVVGAVSSDNILYSVCVFGMHTDDFSRDLCL